ncbi:MAG: adenylate/guanylate cyclase domain-containing protein [Dehalococcoidia bacterium]|nr:adenylate/guanylate cyclase domain-containing protein [Dehalococcoidia bacterium]
MAASTGGERFQFTRTPIRYARTPDGVNLAYLSKGTGIPAVIVGDPLFTHLEHYWPMWEAIPGVEELYRDIRVLFYSPRGFGLSDRNVPPPSVPERIADINHILDHAGIERTALLASGNAGITALLFAATHPDRVSVLVLYMFWSNRVGLAGGLGQLLESNWDLYTVLLAQIVAGRYRANEGNAITELLNASGNQQSYIHWLQQNARVELAELLPQIEAPTLVLCRQERLVGNISPIDGARRLAGGIRNASLQLLPGDSYIIDESVLHACQTFLQEHEGSTPSEAEPETQGGLRTILFTDLQGHVRIVQRLGDEAALVVMRDHERITRQALQEHHGDEVKALGDGFMASFASAREGVECAVALLRAFDAYNKTSSYPLYVRVGINAGEPIAEDDDLFGTAVITASRIAGLAEGSEILVSGVVADLVEGQGFELCDRGRVRLRGFDDPVQVYSVEWQ